MAASSLPVHVLQSPRLYNFWLYLYHLIPASVTLDGCANMNPQYVYRQPGCINCNYHFLDGDSEELGCVCRYSEMPVCHNTGRNQYLGRCCDCPPQGQTISSGFHNVRFDPNGEVISKSKPNSYAYIMDTFESLADWIKRYPCKEGIDHEYKRPNACPENERRTSPCFQIEVNETPSGKEQIIINKIWDFVAVTVLGRLFLIYFCRIMLTNPKEDAGGFFRIPSVPELTKLEHIYNFQR